jgi:adenylosuccinate synthase
MLYIDRDSPVTTPYEKEFNKYLEGRTNHGSCGVGVGQTFAREEAHFSLLFSDLYYPSILKIKLDLLEKYYNFKLDTSHFITECIKLTSLTNNIICTDEMPRGYNDYIFEGSQGLLIDQNFGFFPHVTRANTGLANIIKMDYSPDLYLVTRAYQTRHGNGPMTNREIRIKIPINPFEKNGTNFQGEFRTSILDFDLLHYAINKDRNIRKSNCTLVITCMDVIDRTALTINGKIKDFDDDDRFINFIHENLDVSNLLISNTPMPTMGV